MTRLIYGWNVENYGYLMAGSHGHKTGAQYTCTDHHPDTIQGGQVGKDGKLFYMMKTRCGSSKCPPYVEGSSICSKE